MPRKRQRVLAGGKAGGTPRGYAAVRAVRACYRGAVVAASPRNDGGWGAPERAAVGEVLWMKENRRKAVQSLCAWRRALNCRVFVRNCSPNHSWAPNRPMMRWWGCARVGTMSQQENSG